MSRSTVLRVVPGHPLRTVGVTGRDGVEDRGVVLPHPLRRPAAEQQLAHHALHVAPDHVGALDQQRVAGLLHDEPVEVEVRGHHVRVGPLPLGLLTGRDQRRAAGEDVGSSSRPARLACGVAVEDGAQPVEVPDELGVHRGDLEAATAGLAQHPLVAQQQQRLLHGLAGDGEAVGELLLAQARSRERAGRCRCRRRSRRRPAGRATAGSEARSSAALQVRPPATPSPIVPKEDSRSAGPTGRACRSDLTSEFSMRHVGDPRHAGAGGVPSVDAGSPSSLSEEPCMQLSPEPSRS